MASSETNLTSAALAVALVALLGTIGQLLQQYFATAEGYRRCQPSVLGPWAKRTRLRWRWTQFRFETLFTTPDLALHKYPDLKNVAWGELQRSSGQQGLEVIDGSASSLEKTLTSSETDNDPSQELVCWIRLLGILHYVQDVTRPTLRHPLLKPPSDIARLVQPVLRFRERSWDLMPPDVVRPYASATVSDVAILVRRAGMVWSSFRPSDGIMRAEGQFRGISQTITSTMVRSVGVMLQYSNSKTDNAAASRLAKDLTANWMDVYIPRTEADQLGFGIIPACPGLSLPSFRIGTDEELYEVIDSLDRSGQCMDQIMSLRKRESTWTPRLADLIPIAAPMIRIRGSTGMRIPAPTSRYVGYTVDRASFVVFHARLKEHLGLAPGPTGSAQTRWVLEAYEKLRTHGNWELEFRSLLDLDKGGVQARVAFLDEVQDCFDTTTRYFALLRSTPSFEYDKLLASHMTHTVLAHREVHEINRAGRARNDFGLSHNKAEGMHVYWDKLPLIVKDMRDQGCHDELLVQDSWITMMFRALCWQRCHCFVPGKTVPSEYYGSKLPVFIG
ncbi:MAG: hypothetical protein M1833_003193 [Piccolia ochrophora]|nr:MAG: hypothetical protein M1833_003193 [Piccolia ochrophora]